MKILKPLFKGSPTFSFLLAPNITMSKISLISRKDMIEEETFFLSKTTERNHSEYRNLFYTSYGL